MDKKFIVLMVVFFLIFGFFISSVAKKGFNLSYFAKASTETDPSPQTSLIFAWPQVPNPKVGTKVDINIFIRNANNLPLDKKVVKVVTDLGTINGAKESTSESDKSGRVNFILTTDTPGIANITAFVTDTNQVSHQLDQSVSVKFE